MSSTILESIRLKHEGTEVYERMIGEVMDKKPNGQKAKVRQQHIIKKYIDLIVDTSKELKDLYSDKDNLLQDELNTMRGKMMFKSFYENLNNIREYHIKYPDSVLSTEQSLSIPLVQESDVEKYLSFSGEEVFGKYLDLNELYLQYCNLSNINLSKDHDYIQYLDKFNSFFYISDTVKQSKQYKHYIESLWEYLCSFFLKIQPLVNMNELYADWKKDFEEKWKNNRLPGWKDVGRKSDPQPIRLGMFNSPEELEALGMERLKEGLEALGLKCGGTLKDRANRLWSVRGKRAEDIPDKLKAKPSYQSNMNPSVGDKRKLENLIETGNENSSLNENNNVTDRRKELAWIEFKIMSICEIMMDVVTSTRRHASKQQTRTFEEKEMELYEEEYGTSQDINELAEKANDDDDDEPIYNPLNLPLGWDGKPIPYWLYKLHGLGVEYKCEICGNQSYWGRRNFDRHFQEWRHAYGMKCLGIPNTKHFHDITLIEDAITLYNKIREQLKTEQFIAELEEEFEDSQGNVLNRRTYEDLARQGLL